MHTLAHRAVPAEAEVWNVLVEGLGHPGGLAEQRPPSLPGHPLLELRGVFRDRRPCQIWNLVPGPQITPWEIGIFFF